MIHALHFGQNLLPSLMPTVCVSAPVPHSRQPGLQIHTLTCLRIFFTWYAVKEGAIRRRLGHNIRVFDPTEKVGRMDHSAQCAVHCVAIRSPVLEVVVERETALA
jgi:hypothetical protein